MAPIANALLLATLAAAATCSSAETIAGGWSSKTVTTAMTNLLVEAMTADGDAGYTSAVGSTRVCFARVRSLESQVVAGTNYRFHISGCAVSGVKNAGKCSSATKKSCRAKNYVVQVFEQTWTDTLQVTSIKAESSLRKESDGNAKVSAAAAGDN